MIVLPPKAAKNSLESIDMIHIRAPKAPKFWINLTWILEKSYVELSKQLGRHRPGSKKTIPALILIMCLRQMYIPKKKKVNPSGKSV